jgi:hypothetical protein
LVILPSFKICTKERKMLTYAPFGPNTGNWSEELLESIAKDCYIPAFAGHPWYEVGEWTVDGVVADITNQLGKKGAIGFVALDSGKVVGCIFGYPMNQVELSADLVINVSIGGMYLDETCVAPAYHGQQIGSNLYQLWSKKVGRKVVIARTMTNPPTIVYPWFLKMGYTVIAKYNDEKGRVVLMKDLGRLPNLMVR